MTRYSFKWLLLPLALLAAPVVAHHSYAMFDMTRIVTLDATITQFKWQNPHSFMEADIKTPDGTEHWAIEMTAPNNLVQEGWKRTTVKPGDHVTIYVHPLRSGDKGGSFAGVKLADGRVLGQTTSGKPS
ncbi:MAG TPA: DUF6152 family protein [Croceibacterium sp.]|nr:DUF6152 family protein [Croceibacterium sp.]